MRKARVIESCLCYHLISRLAHRAFFLDDEEKTRAVELLRRVEETERYVSRFGEYRNAFLRRMWNSSEYIDINAWEAGIAQRPEAYEWCSFAAAVKGDEKARRGYAFMYGNADDWDVIRDCHEKSMREAVGMKNRIHFIRYYIAPMLEKGLIVRTGPNHPQSPQQKYRLV